LDLSVKVPLRARRGDIVIVAILVAFLFTTFVFDVTSVLDIDLSNADRTFAASPSWPPHFILSELVRYGEECDHLFLHNPLYFRAMMWGDIFFLGPFYAVALYAFVRGCNWIRVPTFLYGSHVLSYALILGAEQLNGIYASPKPAVLFGFYAPYWIFAVALMVRVRRVEPFAAKL